MKWLEIIGCIMSNNYFWWCSKVSIDCVDTVTDGSPASAPKIGAMAFGGWQGESREKIRRKAMLLELSI